MLLAVDEKIDSVFDIDDATKVARLGNYIFDIGKKIKCYDAVDTGMFLCSPIIFYWLESVKQNGNCSIGSGCAQWHEIVSCEHSPSAMLCGRTLMTQKCSTTRR